MSSYKEYIQKMKDEWIGREVVFDGSVHKVVDVDYNGMLLIDNPTQFTDTTAIETYHIEEAIN